MPRARNTLTWAACRARSTARERSATGVQSDVGAGARRPRPHARDPPSGGADAAGNERKPSYSLGRRSPSKRRPPGGPFVVNAATARIAFAVVLVVALALVPTALAGKGGKNGGTSGGSSSLSLVLLNSTDGLPHYGQTVTFSLSTSATRPYVSVNCYQAGAWVYAASAGFFPDYPWSRNFILAGWSGRLHGHALHHHRRHPHNHARHAELPRVRVVPLTARPRERNDEGGLEQQAGSTLILRK